MTDGLSPRAAAHGTLLGRAVEQRREALGLTQEDVAELMGEEIDPNYITQLETGRKIRLPSQPIISQLSPRGWG